MKLEYIKSTIDAWKYTLTAKYSDSDSQVSSFSLVAWDSDMTNENLKSNDPDSPMITIPPKETPKEIIKSERDTMLEANSIKSFADFQNANIQRLSEAIEGKTPQEAIAYLNSVQEAFAFEIWERKEKSWAAETLKSQIKKSLEAEKGKLLPDYNPANLSKASRTKKDKIKTSKDQSDDKTIKMMMALGISEEDARATIQKTIADTFKSSTEKALPVIEASKPKFKTCPKCKAFNPLGLNECMICKTNIKECEFCLEYTTAKDSKTCEAHKDGVKS